MRHQLIFFIAKNLFTFTNAKVAKTPDMGVKFSASFVRLPILPCFETYSRRTAKLGAWPRHPLYTPHTGIGTFRRRCFSGFRRGRFTLIKSGISAPAHT